MSSSARGKKMLNSHGGQFRLELQDNRILIFDGENNLGFLGIRDDGSIGYDFTPTGVEVTTAALGDMVASDRIRTFTIAKSDTISVTRAANGDSSFMDVSTGALGATMFLCTVSNPAASPAFRFQTPFVTYNTSGADVGKVLTNKYALYDPSTGVVRFFLTASTLYANFASPETWEFHYFLLYQNIP